ncbi:hypothetical protein ABW20_dc0102953 [Dactylellina cionopaga]|nr:hypothetical protein ABW20_dc0102953 [Dactylellina cionopaga]
MPRNHRKNSATVIPSPNGLPNNRMPYKKQSPPLKTPTPNELTNVSTGSGSNKRHGRGSWRSKKVRSTDATPASDPKETPKPQDSDITSCYVAGEAHRFRTPLESPRIPGTPSTPSAISPKTANTKGKKPLPTYFDLRRRETSNISPNDRGFTLMPLSDTELHRYESNLKKQEPQLPHFVQVPMFSRAAPFAQREDYGSYSARNSPESGSRRSSFPPGSGWPHRRSSTTGTMDSGRRASFGYRDHMSFITKPEGYSSRTGSSTKQPSNTNTSSTRSGSKGEVPEQRRGSSNKTDDTGSRKSSLGERRASKVIQALNVSRKDSSEKRVDDGNGNTTQSSQSSSKMVHWRGAEVTEDEAKMLDMLVGKHRLFSDMLMAPLDSSQAEGSDKHPAPGEEPANILRRPSWRRFASTIGASPLLSGLSEETGSPSGTPKPDSGDGVPDIDIREMYAEALQETLGIPIGVTKNRKRTEDMTETAPTLSPTLLDRMKSKDFITAPADLHQTDTQPAETAATTNAPRTTTRTEYETEILSIAMLYGRVIQETTIPALEPSPLTEDPIGRRPLSRAPSLTVPERPSVSFITNALDERSQSDTMVTDVRRMSLNPQSKSRRSSTLARLQKLAANAVGGGDRSKRNSTTSALASPPEYIEDNGKPRHQSLNVPSLVSALTNVRASSKHGGGGGGSEQDGTESKPGSVDLEKAKAKLN